MRTLLPVAASSTTSPYTPPPPGLPCELVTHHDPRRPLLVGGLGQGEEKLGMMRLRLKRHRWFPKLLKCRDPLVFSVGWRRFQSLPVYAGGAEGADVAP